MKKSSVPANKTDRLVQFKFQDAQRIASVVHTVETARRDRRGSVLPRASGGGGASIIEGSFCGAWPKGQVKQIVLAADTTGTSTVSGINLLCSIQPATDGDSSSVYRKCFVVYGLNPTVADCTLLNAEC